MVKYGSLKRSKALEVEISRKMTPIHRILCFYTVWAMNCRYEWKNKTATFLEEE